MKRKLIKNKIIKRESYKFVKREVLFSSCWSSGPIKQEEENKNTSLSNLLSLFHSSSICGPGEWLFKKKVKNLPNEV